MKSGKLMMISEIRDLAKSQNIKLLKNEDKDYDKIENHLIHTAPVILANGEKCVIRISLSDAFNQVLKNEANLYKFAKEHKIIQYPDIQLSGKFHNHEWLTYKYIEGELPGNVYQFNQDFDFSRLINYFEKQTESLREISKDNLKNYATVQYFQQLLNLILKKDQYLATDILVRRTVDYVNKNLHVISSSTYSHGDLHPQNIIFNNEGIKIIDWEISGLYPAAFDYSFVWIRSYNQKFRQRIWGLLTKQYPDYYQESKVIFLINILRDLFEWQLIDQNKNFLLKKSEIINNTNTDEIRKQLRNCLNLLLEDRLK